MPVSIASNNEIYYLYVVFIPIKGDDGFELANLPMYRDALNQLRNIGMSNKTNLNQPETISMSNKTNLNQPETIGMSYKTKRLPPEEVTSLWALTDSNRRPSACKADALNQLS
jgi:hypothetical protein